MTREELVEKLEENIGNNYRILEGFEKVIKGDEYWSPQCKKWNLTSSHLRSGLQENGLVYRRKIE